MDVPGPSRRRSRETASFVRPSTAPLHFVSHLPYPKPILCSLMLYLHTHLISTQITSDCRRRCAVPAIVYTHVLLLLLPCQHKDRSCLKTCWWVLLRALSLSMANYGIALPFASCLYRQHQHNNCADILLRRPPSDTNYSSHPKYALEDSFVPTSGTKG